MLMCTLQSIRTPSDTTELKDGLDSPPFEPSSPLIWRPPLSPRTESSLRRSCAIILQETADPSQAYEDISTAGYDRYGRDDERARTARKAGREGRDQKASSSGRERTSSDPASAPAPYSHFPRNAAASFEHTAAAQSLGQTRHRDNMRFEPLEPTHTRLSPLPSHDGVRSNSDRRPKTSNAACVDRSEDTSSSTTRTNTTYDHGRSTGLTSAALTPGDSGNDKRFSQGISEQILRDGPAASLADATAKAWMAQELSKRRNEPASAPPPSRARDPERPQSRAGSIKEGIKQYIRPRASQDSMRSVSRSDSGKNGGTWWRGGSLRRQGSNKSLRDGQDEEHGRPLSFVRGTDLNRALPALPSLDKWQEKKSPPMHIAHLMRGGSSAKATSLPNANVGSKKSKEKPTIIDEDGVERTISKSEERLRQKDLKKAVEEKMRKGAIVAPSVSSGLLDARQKSLEREKVKASSREREREARTQSARKAVPASKSKEPAVKKVVPVDVKVKVKAKEKPKTKADPSLTSDGKAEKPGLRKRFSRMMLMGGSGPKPAKSERKGFGKIEEHEVS